MESHQQRPQPPHRVGPIELMEKCTKSIPLFCDGTTRLFLLLLGANGADRIEKRLGWLVVIHQWMIMTVFLAVTT